MKKNEAKRVKKTANADHADHQVVAVGDDRLYALHHGGLVARSRRRRRTDPRVPTAGLRADAAAAQPVASRVRPPATKNGTRNPMASPRKPPMPGPRNSPKDTIPRYRPSTVRGFGWWRCPP